MKTLNVLIGLSLALLSARATAEPYNPGGWNRVLSCDNGAAIVDNAPAPGRGYGHTAAQIVIHDMNIIRYFNQAGVAHSGMMDTEWIASGVANEEWGSAKVYSFKIFTGGEENMPSFVNYNGAELYVEVHDASSNANANWHFHNCVQLQ
jgi:hypothetical protein